jgi:UDP-N-acetylmuramate: L-alanyl-gamma-D-glutamyl-meso-diaminopimelate ligase
VVGNVCSRDHVEVVAAQQRGLPLQSLPGLLGEEFLSRRHSVVIAGTHGKTTTTSLVTALLLEGGRDPGCFVGGVPIAMGRGWRLGHGHEFVVEGDEYDSAFFDKGSKFLHYRPRTAVLTSVELDHVDIFSSIEAVRETFRKFVRLLPSEGLLVVAAGSPEALAIAQSEAACRVETYAVVPAGPVRAGTQPPPVEAGEPESLPQATWVARGITYEKGRCSFELFHDGQLFDRYETLLTGDHNVGNITAAIAVAHSLGVAPEQLRRGVSTFAGVRRRQEIRGLAQGVYVIDDYAHHPTAVEQTLAGLRRRFPGSRIVAIYEPRSATSRRKTFQQEFVDALGRADAVIVGRLYDPSKIPAEERFDPGKLALELHRRGTPASHCESVDEIVAQVVERVRPGDVVVVFSSGSFDGLHGKLLTALGDAITPATAADMNGIRGLLRDVRLDWEDLSDEDARNFFVLRNENGFVGCVGLELYGEDAILRSLAVDRAWRGGGYGWMLADAVINFAQMRGVKRIYLLTETASDFFAAKHGFRVVDLSTVGRQIAESTTFRGPGRKGFVAMRLDL